MDEQRIAIITGGASGIGKDLAIQLANKRYICSYRRY